MDLIKSIIKWIIIVFLVVLLIYLISRLGTSTKNKTTKKNVKPVTTVKEKTDRAIDSLVPDSEYNSGNNTNNTNNTNNSQNPQVVAVQDTASTGELSLIIGSFIISIGTFYIYKHEN